MEVKVKRKYRIKNKQKTHKNFEIYEDFVDQLLRDNPDYFAVKEGYWTIHRTVYTIKKESLKELKEHHKEIYDELVNHTSWRKERGVSEVRKNLMNKLDECTAKLQDIKKGKVFHYKVIDFPQWKQVMYEMNMRIQDRLIRAQKYKILDVGSLEIKRIERTANSFKHPIYKYDEHDDYILLSLEKIPRLKNKSVYYARPTFGDEGVSFKNRLFKALREDPSLRSGLRYISIESLRAKNIERIQRSVKRKELKDGSVQDSIN